MAGHDILFLKLDWISLTFLLLCCINRDYISLGLIGKGSIGAVEKVVHRHHSVISHGIVEEEDETGEGGVCGGLFNNCCGSMASNHEEREKKGPCWGDFFSKLCYSQRRSIKGDAFQSSTTDRTVDNSNKNDASTKVTQLNGSSNGGEGSIVSESSAFSAPSTPTMPHDEPRSDHSSEIPRSGSQHDIIPLFSYHPFNSTQHHNAHQHPLRRYALKSIKLERTTKKGPSSKKREAISSTDEAELRNEISILRSLDHPHIVHIIETYEYENRIYMVIDLCENGDLYVLDPYSEGEARGIMRQLLRAVSYMHHRGIVHRDLKVRRTL